MKFSGGRVGLGASALKRSLLSEKDNLVHMQLSLVTILASQNENGLCVHFLLIWMKNFLGFTLIYRLLGLTSILEVEKG